jgi:benzoyl-CoA 2,3-dioxygenase component B
MSAINYSERIPNNVDLANDRKLQRALEQWQPSFLGWWGEMGPSDFAQKEVYLRTAISVDAQGWAHYGAVKCPNTAGGFFSPTQVADRRIGFGDQMGQPAWQQVPGEYRSTLRRLIVTQGDTEPASVEQQRLLGHTCPSLYDLRNLFQINVEEGRHLWAMVYLLHAYFGRDGREEAEELLARHSGDKDKPRILSTFNEPVQDWLSLYCFTYFTDRDGKYQLKSFAESAFDPLSRTCRFMLTEEAHHMFVGETGPRARRQAYARSDEGARHRRPGANSRARRGRSAAAAEIPELLVLVVARPVRLRDLLELGGEFASGMKGRPTNRSMKITCLRDTTFNVDTPEGAKQVPTLNALNEVMRESYLKDCEIGLKRWNRTIERAGHAFRLTLPSTRFRRSIGSWVNQPVDPQGNLLPREEYEKRLPEWVPSDDDTARSCVR